ncbi:MULTISPECIES: 7,8-didemethyl-8-hydroxy-5-deazariboflavin synthase subunit CofG [Spirulina sp. CCY15215]|uniref:7,8-didemethyl-8-hydroxy-5-deazariboflavin synthase subunit CofG n=1 Tax=Spirulina sp. CCY15215 TaxID=2767591 RepID=UPI00195113FD|nr:7,8-didemethyl-8-hydroxy-5-deazariboflavin synthase subunit CofG [Spirulina major]
MNRTVTYSPAYTLVPTYECFNRCSYCNFRVDPGGDDGLTLRKAETILQGLRETGTVEILILSGEVHPQSPRREEWCDRLYDLGNLALSLGFLPHTNAGPLSFVEMARLREVNVSMGLMLEQVTPKLLQTVHKNAPSKVPEVRLQQLVWAGELRIPFTTGLLLGLGETRVDWRESLLAIASLQAKYGHIQEVILQPYSPGNRQSYEAGALQGDDLLAAIALAREILPATITIQIPPNLVPDAHFLLACLEAGARDLGGISPKDEVNPNYDHPTPDFLAQIVEPAGWNFLPRLPVYPQYYDWLSWRSRQAIAFRRR